MAIVRMDRLHTSPMTEVISALVYAAGATDVDTVVIDGQLVMRDRKLLTLDEADVVTQAKVEAKELLNRA